MSNSLHVHLVKQLVTLLLEGRMMSRLVKREEKALAAIRQVFSAI